jgi:hypothetical protein
MKLQFGRMIGIVKSYNFGLLQIDQESVPVRALRRVLITRLVIRRSSLSTSSRSSQDGSVRSHWVAHRCISMLYVDHLDARSNQAIAVGAKVPFPIKGQYDPDRSADLPTPSDTLSTSPHTSRPRRARKSRGVLLRTTKSEVGRALEFELLRLGKSRLARFSSLQE